MPCFSPPCLNARIFRSSSLLITPSALSGKEIVQGSLDVQKVPNADGSVVV